MTFSFIGSFGSYIFFKQGCTLCNIHNLKPLVKCGCVQTHNGEHLQTSESEHTDNHMHEHTVAHSAQYETRLQLSGLIMCESYYVGFYIETGIIGLNGDRF